MVDDNTIINSRLFKKVEDAETFFTISDLIKQIYDDLREDRTRIVDLLGKAMNDSNDLKEAIQEFNEISQLPNIMIFGDIPNKYLANLNDNVQSQIQLLNSLQKLQANWVKRQENNKVNGAIKKDEDDWNMNDAIDNAGKGSEYKDGVKI